MMLARFRSIGWVAAAAVAVLGCYLISLRVATERGALESLEYKIAMSQKHIRLLQTELGTRGQMNQLERWNEQALALSAPEAVQFLPDAEALVALTDRQPALPQPNSSMQEDTQLASAATDLDVMPVTTTPTVSDKPVLRTASYEVAPVTSKLMQDRSMDERSVAKKDKPVKAEKSAKADKSGKAAKSEKLAKSDKSSKTEKSAQADKPAKAEKIAKRDKPAKAEKSAKADKPAKDSKSAKSSKDPKSSKDKSVKLASLSLKGKETRRP